MGTKAEPFDIIIVGMGPAGLGAADKASSKGLKVCLLDPKPLSLWPNNYGVWVDEFEALGLADCFIKVWDVARVIIEEGEDKEVTLPRPYGQVDRIKLKTKLLQRCISQGVQIYSTGVLDVDHGSSNQAASEVFLPGDQLLYGRAVLDATGHSRRLVEFNQTFTPGYQAAYGLMVEVESHPFEVNEMLFMDWRASHLDAELDKANTALPTFLYAMPFSPTRIFVEETSLVARPEVTFDDLKARLKQRLEFLGITVKSVVEEEYCLIPMGGVLPTFPQRTLGIGGTAGMVHPSTGFMVAKTLRSADVLVNAVAEALDKGYKGEKMSEYVWRKVWPSPDLRLRTFMCFGMETLMKLDVYQTRVFFNTFFRLPRNLWSGFLSWKVTNVTLASMAGLLFKDMPASMKYDFITACLPFLPSFVKNVIKSTANRFSSTPWAGLSSQSRKILMESKAKSVRRSDWKDMTIPLPRKRYAVSTFDEAKEKYEKMLGIELDVPRPASQLQNDHTWTQYQQRKLFDNQPALVSVLPALEDGSTVDVVVIGAGPAGLALAGELGAQGLSVGLIAPDTPFTNNYGVWMDEFEELGLEDCIVGAYDDVLLWTEENSPAGGYDLGRRYGRVGRAELRATLLKRCLEHGVKYHADLVSQVENQGGVEGGLKSTVQCKNGFSVEGKLSVFSTGHNHDVNHYAEDNADAPPFGWQTAYGIEVKLPDHPFPADRAVFMDFRQTDPEVSDPKDPSWRVPSFLYVLPDGKDTVFLEETCLASSVQIPFDELKRRLYRRLALMGIAGVELENIIEEEASWIPLGGPLPSSESSSLAFGAAAGLVHPASGYSIVNSLRKTKPLAEAITKGLARGGGLEASRAGWESLWSGERLRQTAFNQFGMELLVDLEVQDLQSFFVTFYSLPKHLSQRFLSHDLNSAMLVYFAFAFFLLADNNLRWLLIKYLSKDAGKRFTEVYMRTLLPLGSAESAVKLPPASAASSREVLTFHSPKAISATQVAIKSQHANEKQGYLAGFQLQHEDAKAPKW
eukprot:CAMPEP_0196574134 /NCGR_PEP_ID=MMETSP1081-20130531/3894_1 /TAXON_ID=36882 /ORGANISM="Pyramimonas amylifera, Strain CCMP720" /LENGTH=1023 /DNA_ID=CAMNT_0041892055 /DNA_START=361 /DNA_END=3429 /DNA_ORIENTATION=+